MERIAILVALALCCAFSQSTRDPAQETRPTFTQRVSLVLVPVVVRDSKGQVVGGLEKEDFELLDKGKPQNISIFAIETSGVAAAPGATQAQPGRAGERAAPAPVRPRRFVAYLFDDVHLSFGDLVWVRDGVKRNLATLDATDRAAIYTISGRTTQEFTSDRARLEEALGKLRPTPISRSMATEIPDVSYYQADLILNKGGNLVDGGTGPGGEALNVATMEVIYRLNLDPRAMETARTMAWTAAQRAYAAGEHETQIASMVLKQVIRRMGYMPGQRTVIFLSPGFLAFDDAQARLFDAVDLATRLNVVVSALDARGLYTDMPNPELYKMGQDPQTLRLKQRMEMSARRAVSGPLEQVSESTGGRFIENTNDIDGGLKRMASPPEYSYVLGFSPRDLTPNGSFHPLKVRLTRREHLNVQARRGYYASRQLIEATEAAKQELEEAVFAPEDIHDPAIEAHTEFFKSSPSAASLSVLTHLDLRRVAFRKSGDRNSNDLTLVACLFDQNGNYVDGKRSLVSMKLRDETLAAGLGSGYTFKTVFEVPQGTYAVRVAVRDADGGLMFAESSVVEIP